jgi:hypothetical protein
MNTPNPVDLDFISIRHKLLDVAAFLDRVEQSGDETDYRVQALKTALPLLQKEESARTRSILEHFSDHSIEPVSHAPSKGAGGAAPPETSS